MLRRQSKCTGAEQAAEKIYSVRESEFAGAEAQLIQNDFRHE
jgi:hypothetical protein